MKVNLIIYGVPMLEICLPQDPTDIHLLLALLQHHHEDLDEDGHHHEGLDDDLEDDGLDGVLGHALMRSVSNLVDFQHEVQSCQSSLSQVGTSNRF